MEASSTMSRAASIVALHPGRPSSMGLSLRTGRRETRSPSWRQKGEGLRSRAGAMRPVAAAVTALALSCTGDVADPPSRELVEDAATQTLQAEGTTIAYSYKVPEGGELTVLDAQGEFDANSVAASLQLEMNLGPEIGSVRADLIARHPLYFFRAPLLALQGVPRGTWIRWT